jgi:OPA family glycerol-3-phosphate transporter-like MFS transporter 1/2
VLGSFIGYVCLEHSGWWMVFFVSGTLMICMSLVVLFFLPVSPEEVGLTNEGGSEDSASHLIPTDRLADQQPVLTDAAAGSSAKKVPDTALSFCEAVLIPGVLNFAICLFFVKVSEQVSPT